MISEVIKIDDGNKEYVFNRNNRKLLLNLNRKTFINYQISQKLKNKEITYDEVIRNGIIE